MFLFAAEGEDAGTGAVLTTLAYCLSIIAFRGWRPPKIIAGGWAANIRYEYRWLANAHAIVLLPLALLIGIKLTMHRGAIDVADVMLDLGFILAAFWLAWTIRFLPLRDEIGEPRDR